jgi:serine O-acetyltransferase
MRIRWSADVPCTTEMDDRVVLAHNGLGVVIHPATRFLGRAMIFQSVTIGESGRPGEDGLLPTIGDRVVIGAGSFILGPVNIGDGCLISAGALVTKDMPEGSQATGNPACFRPLQAGWEIDRWF